LAAARRDHAIRNAPTGLRLQRHLRGPHEIAIPYAHPKATVIGRDERGR